MGYSNFEVDRIIKSMVILCDTREQETPAYYKRIQSMDYPVERRGLDFGDYSAYCILPDGSTLDLSDRLAVERKMSISEICANYTKGRERFKKEFERAKNKNAKLYVLIENGSWEKILQGKYRSQLNPKALFASMMAWSIRYNYMILFCEPETSGKLIQEILKRELKEMLEHGKLSDGPSGDN